MAGAAAGEPLSGAAIAKRLAACNKSTRDRAVRLLSTWLPSQPAAAVCDGDLVKIWKGLFYCVWHADKLPAQLDLISRLSSLLQTLDPPLAARYLSSFLLTIRREWSGIDFLRLDKFYLLIRTFLHNFFQFLKNHDWDSTLVSQMVTILSEKSLLSSDKFQAKGVNYHLAEIFLDEVEPFLPLASETLDLLLKPFLDVLVKCTDKVMVNKMKVNVFARLVESGESFLENVECGGVVEKFGKVALVLGFSEKFFGLASDAETIQGNRKVLFSLHERFLKLEKALEKSGVSVSLPELGNGSLVEKMVSEEDTVESDDRLAKKRKKGKKAAADGGENKGRSKKEKKSKKADLVTGSNGSAAIVELNGVASGEDANGNVVDDDGLVNFDETVISNLQKQFEKVAAETGIGTPLSIAVVKKRKRGKSAEGKTAVCSDNVNGGSANGGKIADKSAKKVRFSMKNNLVWKPHNPLPPENLRLPPSVTPRGSALKKGVSPGPIRESPPTAKKIKVKGSSVKKGRKSVTPAMKRLLKLQNFSV